MIIQPETERDLVDIGHLGKSEGSGSERIPMKAGSIMVWSGTHRQNGNLCVFLIAGRTGL